MKELGELRNPTGTRPTLKLKTPAKKSPLAPTAAPAAAPAAPPKAPRFAKANDWADKHKQRMQAEMDALGFGTELEPSRERLKATP